MFDKNKKQDAWKKKVIEANKVFLAAERIHSIEEIFSKLHSTDEYQRTPLHRAVECGIDSQWVQRMLKEGANPNVQDDNGNTPLHYAAQNSDLNTVKLLLKHNANPHTINEYKRNALCDMNAANHEPLLALYELLLKHGARGCFWERHHFLSPSAHQSLISLAVKYYDPKSVESDSQKNTLLHWATYYGLEKEVEVLLKKGADPSLKNDKEETALIIATDKEFHTILGMLKRALGH